MSFTDNGPHYHNTAVLTYLSEVNDVFNVKLLEYNNFEEGEGKTALDTHFAHISHKIVRYVRLGNDLETGEELGELVQVIDNCFLMQGTVLKISILFYNPSFFAVIDIRQLPFWLCYQPVLSRSCFSENTDK